MLAVRPKVWQNNGKPFQVMTDTGPIIFLNASYSDEIRNDHRFGFTEFLHRLFLTKYSGLEGVILPVGFQNDVLKATVRKNLTQSLGTSFVMYNHGRRYANIQQKELLRMTWLRR